MKNLKFKKIKKGTLNVQGQYISSKVFIFCMDFLDSVKNKYNLQLINQTLKERINYVESRINKKEYKGYPISAYIDALNLNEFRKINIDTGIKEVRGFWRGDCSDETIVAYQIGNAPCIDAEYVAPLFWDTNTTVLIKDATSPVVVLKENKPVFLVAPLNPNKLKGRN
jgi:hypothetical protein